MPKTKKTKNQEDTPKEDSKNKTLEVAIAALKKQFGDDVVEWLDKRPGSGEREVISTGSLALDAALGVGGFVKGRLYELYGSESGGKTTLALSAIREVQKTGGSAIFVDAEHALDTNLLTKMGIDLSRIALVTGFTGEENLDATNALMSTGEFDICVIDSISALQPAAEANLKSFGDNTMGLHPRLMSRMCREFTPKASRTKTALLLINQIRANMSGYGSAKTTSGGNALRHHYTGRVCVSGNTKSRHIHDSDGNVIGHKVGFEITKNKLFPPFRTAEVDLIYGKGFDTYGEILDLSVDMGLVNLSGAWYKFGEEKFQGRNNALEYLKSDSKIKDSLFADITKVLGFGQ